MGHCGKVEKACAVLVHPRPMSALKGDENKKTRTRTIHSMNHSAYLTSPPQPWHRACLTGYVFDEKMRREKHLVTAMEERKDGEGEI